MPNVLEKRCPDQEGHIVLANAMIQAWLCHCGGPSFTSGENVARGSDYISFPVQDFKKDQTLFHYTLFVFQLYSF